MVENLITEIDILDEAKECFLTYAEEVLTDRAIPAAEDGLLSSQRKILWTMSEVLNMDSKSKTKKCQALVGSTLSTAYMHGDAACYGVLCKMSQKYLMRYPLIHGQGSLGTQEDNSMVSSSRYTEAKPSIYADLMMKDYEKGVVPIKETYNGEYMEPVFLPSLFPNSICNGRQAIGISMSHNSLPANLTEVCNAAIAFINKGEDLTIDELMLYIKGPDFPLAGTVLNSDDIKEAFLTGKSKVSLKVQGDYKIEGQNIIFTTIPYRTYRNKIREQIEANVDVLGEYIDDFDDQSSIGQNYLVFHVKNGVSPSVALNKLFLLTDLQTSLSYNMNYIVNGTPKLCSMMDLLRIYVKHQENVLIKATEYDEKKAATRAHILEGLIAAAIKIDEVIVIIKSSENQSIAKEKLIEFLSISEIQAKAILDMKLGKLTRIDKNKLVEELNEKKAIINRCELILSSKDERNKILINQITDLRDKYGDERRTKLVNIEIPKEKKEPVVIEPKDCVVIINGNNSIKRVDVKNFAPRKRNTTGVKNHGDITIFSQKTNTQDSLLVFTSKGKMYRVLVDTIPEGTSSSNGISLSSLIKFENDEVPMAYTTLTKDTDKKYLLFATKKGIVKKTPLEEYKNLQRSGVLTIKLKEDDELAVVTFVNNEQVMIITREGFCIRIESADLPISSRVAQGIKGMKVGENDRVISMVPITDPSNCLAIVAENGLVKKVALDEFTPQARGGKGVCCHKSTVSGAELISNDDCLLISGDIASIVLKSEDIPLLSRISQGNNSLKNNSKIISISKV